MARFEAPMKRRLPLWSKDRLDRRLPEEPLAREAALGPCRTEADQLVRILDGILSTYLPSPLSDPERLSIREHLAEVLYKYNGRISCAPPLLAAVNIVTFRMKSLLARRKEATTADQPQQAPPEA